jgi:NTP pyrophosphatase (non-canonical NTP hydrolase)
MRLSEIQKNHYEWLKEMNWTGKTTPLEQLALIASEIGEAVNECRGEVPTENLKYELADIVLRSLGMAEQCGIDLEPVIIEKMEKNRLRGSKGRVK